MDYLYAYFSYPNIHEATAKADGANLDADEADITAATTAAAELVRRALPVRCSQG